jgi:hypothetical protein
MTGFVVIGTPVYVKYIIVSLGAILNGIGGSVIWTSTSTYIHKVCHYYHK